MSDAEALKAAIDLFHLPSQVRVVRSSPLPKGTEFLLRLASGETPAVRKAEMHSDRDARASRAAAIFFIEQILLSPESDEYRILGLDRTATVPQLRAHMALLLKWLHPDLTSDEHKALMARRVIEAWNTVKSSDRRLARKSPIEVPIPARSMSPTFSHPQAAAKSLAVRQNCDPVRRGSIKGNWCGFDFARSTRPPSRLRKFLSYVFRLNIVHYKN